MNKKAYEAPTVKKVRLEVKNAVLATCNASPNMTPKDRPTQGAGCHVNHCFN
jgi:hypothetical protein